MLPTRPQTPSLSEAEHRAIATVRAVLLRAHGVDAALLRPSFIRRRLLARSRRVGVSDLGAYSRLLRRDPFELAACSRALANRFSRFRADPSLFAFLEDTIFPALSASSDSSLCVVSAGCSSGQEPYALAIAALEHLAARDVKRGVRVLGFDLDRFAVQQARRGTYLRSELNALPERWRELYFDALPDGRAEVSTLLRSIVRIRRADILARRARSPHGLVFCRNVLIHLLPEARARVVSALLEMLAPTGYLVVAPVEAPAIAHPELVLQNRRLGIFRRLVTSS